MSMGTIQQDPVIKVAVIDHDQTELTQFVVEELKSKFSMVSASEDAMERHLMEYKLDYALVLSAGFTESIIEGRDVQGEGFSIKESNLSIPVKTYIDNLLQQIIRLAQAADGDQLKFYNGLHAFQSENSQLEQQAASTYGWQKSHIVMGMMGVALLFTSFIFAFALIANKDQRTLQRTLAAPIRLRNYMLQHIFSSLLVCLAQIALFLLVIKVSGLYMGGSWLSVYLLFAVFALVCVSFSVFLSSISKNALQIGIFGLLIVQPMSLIGGAYFSKDVFPETLQKIGQFVPVSWLMEGIDKLLLGESLLQLGPQMLMLLLFSLIFFLLGTWKKTDLSM